MTDEQLADLRARITPGPWELMLGSFGRNRICATHPCINGLSALFTIAHVNVPEESERGYTDDAFNPDAAAANAEAMRLVPDLLAEAVRLREALVQIDALDPEHLIDGCTQAVIRGLVLRMGETARAALSVPAVVGRV